MNTLYPPFTVGGAEKSVSLLAEALARSGDEVSVITLSQKRDMEVTERNGVLVYRLPLRNIYWPFGRNGRPNIAARALWQLLDLWNPRAARDVGSILDIEQPEVVHTNNISGFSVAIFAEVRRRNIRLVHTLRDYYLLCSRYSLFRQSKVCERRCLDCKLITANHLSSARALDAVVSNSQFVLDTHVQHGYFLRSPKSVIYNIAEAPSSPNPTSECSREPATGSLIFGFIGKLCPDKGIEKLLAATRLLACPAWRLRIAGAGEDRYVAELRKKFKDPRIEWVGFAEPKEFYQSIDIGVIASVWAEPLPRTLIETFAAGKSAICARSGGIPEIAMLGRVVETYDATDETALARAMDGAMADHDRWQGGGWRDQDAMIAFSEASVTARYHEVYRGDGREPKAGLQTVRLAAVVGAR
ncbi:MAG TPA: glycosyltransferase family 4 protein [Acidisarcina sp.]